MYHFVYADEQGNGYIDEEFYALGLLGDSFVEPGEDELIPLPEGASLTMIPGRSPVVMNIDGEFMKYPGIGWVMGALLPQGYTRTLLPAFLHDLGGEPLPLFGYAAVCAKDGELYVAAVPTDEDDHWNPRHFNTEDLAERVAKLQNKFPNNRILQQVGHCALTYGCFTAQNIFYERWEGGIPVSPVCNARCIGCISLQPSECCPSPQTRLTFVPTVQEVVEIGVHHLENAEDGIISFGQGCEGDPSMQADLIAEAITQIRQQTKKGTINMNTNAGNTEGIAKICAAGIDSLRVSLNSATEELYQAYYRPLNYNLSDVKASLSLAAEQGVYTYLNLLTYPGVNDTVTELENLLELITEQDVKAVQIRNLNIDPAMLENVVKLVDSEALGIPAMLNVLQEEVPEVEIGNYTKPFQRKM
ncbi:MAG: radical SAM protein [Peptococcaceae bacterium]|nr:radical SAM protein [Peptococcaceae bacterium]